MPRHIIAFILFSVVLSVSGHMASAQGARNYVEVSKDDTTDITFVETNYGILRTSDYYIINNSNSPNGTHKLTNNYTFIKTTDTVPAVLHINFGVEFFLKSTKDTVVDLQILWKFPQKMINAQNKEYGESFYTYSSYTNMLTFSSYEFEEYFEVKPGIWQLLIFCNRKLIYSRYFLLVMPI